MSDQKSPPEEFLELRDADRTPAESLKQRRTRLPQFIDVKGGRLERETNARLLTRMLDALGGASDGVTILYRYKCSDNDAEIICDRFLNELIAPLVHLNLLGTPLRFVAKHLAQIHIAFFPASAHPPGEMVEGDEALEELAEVGWGVPREENNTTH